MSETKTAKSGSSQLIDKHTTSIFRGIAAVMVVLSHYAEWWRWFFQPEGGMETLRTALTKLGVYGVDIFFLFSGYAMVKSLYGSAAEASDNPLCRPLAETSGNPLCRPLAEASGNPLCRPLSGQSGKPSGSQPSAGRMNLAFIWKRIKNVYIPYFIIVGIIELASGGFASPHDFWLFAGGYGYWYMHVLFVLYTGFIAIYALIRNKHLRVILFLIFTCAYSHTLYKRGMYDFWYVSNITFALGVIIAEYEKYVKKLTDAAGLPLAAVLGVLMLFVVKSGLCGGAAMSEYTKVQLPWSKIGATFVWTLLIAIIAAKRRIKDKIFAFLGKNSLYIYLTHTYIFMHCVNRLSFAIPASFAASAVITVAVSALCGLIVTYLPKLIMWLVRNLYKTSTTP